MRCWVAPLLLIFLLSPRASALGEEEVRALLAVVKRDAGDDAWDAAVERLRAAGDPELSERLERVLLASRRVAERRHRAASNLLDTIAERGEIAARRLAREIEAWNAARAEARAWIFDRAAFPDVDHPVVTPEEGYGEAESRGRRARSAFDALRGHLEREAREDEAWFPEKLARGRAERDDAAQRWARLARVIGDGYGPPAARDDPLSPVLDALARDDLAAATRGLDALEPGWERLRAWYGWCRRILAANERERHGLDRSGARAIVDLNDYRIALGIPPLRVHAALVKTAQGHTAEMRDLRYFAHESPTEGRRTASQRARLAGYSGQVHECLSQRGSAAAAITTWRYDGAHHRDLLFGIDVGLSNAAPWTLNVGGGDRSTPRPPRYAP